jgi:hypothetical protein
MEKWGEIDMMQGNVDWTPNSDLHLLNLYFSDFEGAK